MSTTTTTTSLSPLLPSFLMSPSRKGKMVSSSRHNKAISPILIFSYVFDWIVIGFFTGIGAWLANLMPNRRPFDLLDASISFPLVDHETIPIWLAGVLAIVFPAVVIIIVSLLLVPGPTVSSDVPKSLVWRRKLWEWYAGWAGLGMASALAFFIISAMKNLFGKPRPHTLAACLPGLKNLAEINNYENYRVGGFGDISILVNATICTQTDPKILRDTFRSFPSGHSASSAAGLVYLSLFLASKLAITIPFLSPSSERNTKVFAAFPSRMVAHKNDVDFVATEHHDNTDSTPSMTDPLAGSPNHDNKKIAARSQSAAPPLYLLSLALAPIALSVYICATRFSDFYHFGFDILFGFFIGTVSAIFAFRFYHLPIRQGAGWAWGPRSHRRALWAGVGVGSYAVVDDVEYGRDDDMIELLPSTPTTPTVPQITHARN